MASLSVQTGTDIRALYLWNSEKVPVRRAWGLCLREPVFLVLDGAVEPVQSARLNPSPQVQYLTYAISPKAGLDLMDCKETASTESLM